MWTASCIIWVVAFVLPSNFLDIRLVNAINCGEVTLTRPLIIGGSDSDRGEWPFAVALYRVDNRKYFCGGTVISHKHILTDQEFTEHSFSRQCGSAHNLSSSDEEEGAVRRNVSQIHVHTDWKVYGQKYDADIAILTLSEDITFSKFIQPVCIPSVDETVGTTLNFKGYIIGWAPTNRSRVETPRHAMTTVLNASYYFDTDPNLSHYSSQRSFRGWDENGFPDTGDSGRGLLVLSGSAWVQVGIISATCTNRTGHIIPKSPAIFTNTREFRSWIVEVTEGAVGEANGMKIILNCIYMDLDIESIL